MNSKRKTRPSSDCDYGGRAAAAAASEDLLTEILVRLPAKSVIRFKLVCKRWLSLISGDQFRRLHTLRRHKPQPSLILRTRIPEFLYFNPSINGGNLIIPYHFTVPNPKILSSCNGLMLLRCDDPETECYIYNPTTKQSRKIVLNRDDKFPRVLGLNLAFDPSKSPHYKIVCVRRSRISSRLDGTRSYRVEVYDSVSRAWKLCLEPFTDSAAINFSAGVHWNNSIYWKTDVSILCFDIDKNVVGSLPRPTIPWYRLPRRLRNEDWRKVCYFSQLQELNGHLYHFVIDHRGESVALWELQLGSRSRWFLKYHDPPPASLLKRRDIIGELIGCPRPTFDTRYSASLLRFVGGSDGEETTSTLVTYLPGKIRAYRFPDGGFEELVDLTTQPFYRDNSLQFDFQDVHQFGESLALV